LADYIVRVELKGRNQTAEEYNNLHALMQQEGFVRTITGVITSTQAPSTRALPHATYHGRSNSTAQALHQQLNRRLQSEIQQDIVLLVASIQSWVIS
jgi:hypothetical protein